MLILMDIQAARSLNEHKYRYLKKLRWILSKKVMSRPFSKVFNTRIQQPP